MKKAEKKKRGVNVSDCIEGGEIGRGTMLGPHKNYTDVKKVTLNAAAIPRERWKGAGGKRRENI